MTMNQTHFTLNTSAYRHERLDMTLVPITEEAEATKWAACVTRGKFLEERKRCSFGISVGSLGLRCNFAATLGDGKRSARRQSQVPVALGVYTPIPARAGMYLG